MGLSPAAHGRGLHMDAEPRCHVQTAKCKNSYPGLQSSVVSAYSGDAGHGPLALLGFPGGRGADVPQAPASCASCSEGRTVWTELRATPRQEVPGGGSSVCVRTQHPRWERLQGIDSDFRKSGPILVSCFQASDC